MTWTWRFEDAEGNPINVDAVRRPEFPSQSDAESWVGECWRDLLESGVEQVTLLEDEREAYGPMSLRPPE